MSDPAKIWDRFAKGYAKRPVGNEEAYQKKLTQTKAYLNSEVEMFEFACGTGTTALHHAPFVKHIDAIDISPKMLEIAQAKADAAGVTNVRFAVNTIESFEADPGQYDIIMGHSILHLVDEPQKVIEKAYNMLKPGGVFVSSTACLKGVMPWLRLVLPVGHFFGILPKIKFISSEALLEDIKRPGFMIETHWQPSKTEGLFVIAKKPV